MIHAMVAFNLGKMFNGSKAFVSGFSMILGYVFTKKRPLAFLIQMK